MYGLLARRIVATRAAGVHQNSIHSYLSKFAILLTILGFIAWSPTGAAEHPFNRPAEAGLTVVTLNMAREANPDRILAEWRKHPQIWNADVLALQEVIHFAGQRPSIAHLLAKEIGYYVVSQPNLPN